MLSAALNLKKNTKKCSMLFFFATFAYFVSCNARLCDAWIVKIKLIRYD